jgi:hypothetical protein
LFHAGPVRQRQRAVARHRTETGVSGRGKRLAGGQGHQQPKQEDAREHAVETLTLADGFAILESVFDIAGVVAAMTEGELGVPE